MNGPLITAHASLSNDCSQCHTAAFSHVRDSDCLKCHSKTIQVEKDGSARHHPFEGRESVACSVCHHEHRGNLRLREMDDRQCTFCHAELSPETGARAVRFTSDPKDHPDIRLLREKGTDPGALKFPHKHHLAAEGVLVGSKEQTQNKKVLACEDCHVPNPDGEYMAPIVYEERCSGCHAHKIQPLAEGIEVPHTAPVGVREFLLHHFYANPPQEEPKPARRRRYVDEEDFEANVRTAVDTIERVLYRTGTEEKCAQCHELSPGPASAIDGLQPLPQVAHPGVPDRWLDHASFSHKSHLNLECAECHANVAASENSDDVLLPSISTCANCHSRGKDPDNCTLCHRYHPTQLLETETGPPMRSARAVISSDIGSPSETFAGTLPTTTSGAESR